MLPSLFRVLFFGKYKVTRWICVARCNLSACTYDFVDFANVVVFSAVTLLIQCCYGDGLRELLV